MNEWGTHLESGNLDSRIWHLASTRAAFTALHVGTLSRNQGSFFFSFSFFFPSPPYNPGVGT